LSCDSGAAAVEFALVLMLLATLLFGIIQYGYTFFEYIQVAHAAREGVRWGALGSTDTEIRAKAAAASPTLGSDATIAIGRSDPLSISVTVTHPVTRLAPLPTILVPASVSSTAVQRIE
jgi:Flp pilus assembly protein TadG